MKSILFSIPLILASSLSWARWALPHEADAAIEENNVHVLVHKDVTSVIDSKVSFSILKETARERWGTLHMNYAPKNSDFKVTLATTRNEDQTYEVAKQDIVDSAIQATEHGFDEQRQVVIAFPHVKVGSLLTYGMHEVQHHPVVKDTYSWRFNFGEGSLFNKTEIEFESERPLYFQLNDPQNSLQFTDLSKPPAYHYHVSLKKPIFRQILEEDHSYLPDAEKTWVAVSSAENYADMFKGLAQRYEEILAKPLPKVFQAIVNEARKEQDPLTRLNTLTSRLSETIRYMGDWRAVDGGMVPHTLDEIASSHHGDCKDFSIVLVRMARELGFEATTALVERGAIPHDLPKIPQLSSFNHAIAAIMVGSQRHWLDGTNFVSDADGVQDDIAFREALLLDPQIPHLEAVAWNAPEKNLNEQIQDAVLSPGDVMNSVLTVHLTGFQTYSLVGQDLRVSHEQLENTLLERYAYKSDLLEYQIEPFSFKSRISKPLEYTLHMKKSVQNFQTSVGESLPVAHLDLSYIYKLDVRDRVSQFIVGLPAVYRMNLALDHFNYRGKSIKNCKVSIPALDYEMKVSYLPKNVKVSSELKIKKRYMSAEELHSSAFQSFQKKIKECAREKYFVYQPAAE